MQTGMILMPGFVDSDTKVARSCFRGYYENIEQDDWVTKYALPIEKRMSEKDNYFFSLLSFVEMLKAGTTCFCDSYFNEEETIKAATEVGIRGLVSNTIYNCKLINDKKFEILLEQCNKSNAIGCYLSLNYPEDYTIDDLKNVVTFAKRYNSFIKINYLETKKNIQNIKKIYRKTVTDYLKEAGLFDIKTILANVVWADEYDIFELKQHDVSVINNPVSNSKFGTGIPDLKLISDAGINIGLGSSGLGSSGNLDMFEVMRSCGYSQRTLYKNANVISAKQICEMATINSAKALGLDKQIGTIEEGKKADLILIDINKPHLVPMHNVYSTIVYSCSGSDVDTVIVNGKIIMENRELVDINEREVMKWAKEAVKRIF
jgi:5-methylthioadenosine/S-adenosylhomocysteine deaminase